MESVERAFVSSTFDDLKPLRELVRNLLIRVEILPVGMEDFPASPTDRWRVIQQRIDSSDMYVLLVAGRYGSISSHPDHAGRDISWTEAEHEYAVSKGKYVIALVHSDIDSLPARSVDGDRANILRFREKLRQAPGLYANFSNDSELVSQLYPAVINYRSAGPATSRAGLQSSQLHPAVSDFLHDSYDRRYELIQIDWEFTSSAAYPDRWDASATSTRTFVANWPEGISNFTYSIGRASRDFSTFHLDAPPRFTVLSYAVAGEAEVQAIPQTSPRILSDTSYRRDIRLFPPLKQGQLATLRYLVEFPGFKLGTRELALLATANTPEGARATDHCQYLVDNDVRRLVLSAHIPDELGATKFAPQVKKAIDIDDLSEKQRVLEGALFTTVREVRNGAMGTFLTLDVPNPRPNRRYQLRWGFTALAGPLSHDADSRNYPRAQV